MCGIAGTTEPTRHKSVAAMLRALAHRGPDHTGIWTDADRKITLGCVRLATTDPSNVANQPLISSDRRFVLAFNGYIAGHRRLIAELTRHGEAVSCQSDAELVLAIMARSIIKGTSPAYALAELSGQYALALWDNVQSCLWLARDPLGIKPLYVQSHPNGQISFASEMMAFSEWGTMTRDQAIKPHYLAHLFVPAPQTGALRVTQLQPGMLVRNQNGKTNTDLIAHPAKSVQHGRDHKVSPERLRSAVRQSVADAMDADCTVGTLVSGGLDSAGVAALACDVARERGQSPPVAFVMGFDDPAYDESVAATKLCQHLGQSLHVVKAPASSDEIHQELCNALDHVGGPFANPSIVLLNRLSQAVSAHVKVCLSGDGGDELFGGYPRYRAGRFYETCWRHLPKPLRRLIAKLSGYRKNSKAHRFLAGASDGDEHAFSMWNNRCVIAECDALLAVPETLIGRGLAVSDAMMMFDRDVTLPGNQLLMSDRCGMAFGLEYRLPILGHDVVRLAASVPAACHLGQGPKTLWRQAIASDLPQWHVQNPKMGFNPPVAMWLSRVARYRWGSDADIRDTVFDELAISRDVKDAYWQRAISGKDLDMARSVWALMVWKIWQERGGSDIRSAIGNAADAP